MVDKMVMRRVRGERDDRGRPIMFTTWTALIFAGLAVMIVIPLIGR